MGEKYFKRDDAESLLPVIGPWLEQARSHKRRMEVLDQELARAASRIMLLGGSVPAYRELTRQKGERDRVQAKVLEAVDQIQATGCLVKDLEQGLVDFPSLREGEEVYLCWKLGEERIGYWHGVEEGFAGRKPLDDASSRQPPPGGPRVQ